MTLSFIMYSLSRTLFTLLVLFSCILTPNAPEFERLAAATTSFYHNTLQVQAQLQAQTQPQAQAQAHIDNNFSYTNQDVAEYWLGELNTVVPEGKAKRLVW